MRDRRRLFPRLSWALAAVTALALGACFVGVEGDKEPPPGFPGGLCLAPDGACEEGTCNQQRNFCYDPVDPCDGFFCGGADRGVCTVTDDALPQCLCEPGFHTRSYALYCCPEDGTDPRC